LALMSERRISRRTAVKGLAAAGLGAASAALTDASSAKAVLPGHPGDHWAQNVIMIIRHGEKPTPALPAADSPIS
jgi:hypothetical protein